MLLTTPNYRPEFLKDTRLGVEFLVGRTDQRPGWEEYIPFVHGVHLPFDGLNFASLDDARRARSIDVVKEAIVIGCQFPVEKMVIHTLGIESIDGEVRGNYERMIDGLRDVADFAATKGITLCIENDAQHGAHRVLFGVTAEQWYQIQGDVDRENVMLTLDTSHAACAAALLVGMQVRFDYMYEFLRHPERIGWVHWSDSRLTKAEAYYKDMHLVPGEGDLPLDFHRKIKNLDVVKTLEQNRPEEDILKGLAFVEAL